MERLQREPPYLAHGVGPNHRQPRVIGELPLQRISGPRCRNPRDFGAQFRREAELDRMDAARVKLGAREISTSEAEQLPRNRHAIVRNPRSGGREGERLLLVGHTDGGRTLTLVIERTVDPTSWLIVTDWTATHRERRIIS
jgi:hypothetical protein